MHLKHYTIGIYISFIRNFPSAGAFSIFLGKVNEGKNAKCTSANNEHNTNAIVGWFCKFNIGSFRTKNLSCEMSARVFYFVLFQNTTQSTFSNF